MQIKIKTNKSYGSTTFNIQHMNDKKFTNDDMVDSSHNWGQEYM